MPESYIMTAHERPPEDIVVETVDGGGCVRDLKRKGNLYFLPDESMYMYFVPQMWKHIPYVPRHR